MLWDASADDLILSGAAGLIVPDGQFTLGSTAITSTGAEINILDGGNAASSVTLVDADRIIVNDNGTMKQVAVSALNTYTSASIAADDISAGDGAVNITTSSGNITIDAAANDSDIIFKGTDNNGDITMLTLDGSADGAATFKSTITASGVITGTGFTAGNAVIAEAELELLDGLTAGTAIASKVVTTDANIDSTGMRNLTISGEIDAATGDFSGAVDVAGATTTAAITASGIIKTDDTTAATTTTDGSLQTDGGLSVVLDAVIGDDLFLLSDSSVIHFGADSEITLTHTNNTGLTLNSGSGSNTFQIQNTDGGAGDGPIMKFYRNSSSPADSDNTGEIRFLFNNDASEVTESAIISTNISDVSNGTEDATLDIRTMSVGTMRSRLQFETGGTVFNQDSVDVDFRVESNSQVSAFLIDAGNDTAAFNVPLTGTSADFDGGVTIDNITIDGTEIDLSSGDLTVDVAGDIILDAGGGNIKVSVATTQILDIANSSSDVIIKPVVDAKDIIFQQRDGTSILEINDGAYARFTAAAVAPEATLTDASTVTWNALTQSVAKVTLGGNRTIGLASGGVSGAFISILVIQDGTGSRTVTWNAAYEFAADAAPTLTTTANLGDLFVFRYNGAKWLEVGRNLALTLS